MTQKPEAVITEESFGLTLQPLLEECEAVARSLYRWEVIGVSVGESRVEAVSRPWFGDACQLTIQVEGGDDPHAAPCFVSIEAFSPKGRGSRVRHTRILNLYLEELRKAATARIDGREPGV